MDGPIALLVEESHEGNIMRFVAADDVDEESVNIETVNSELFENCNSCDDELLLGLKVQQTDSLEIFSGFCLLNTCLFV